MGRSVGQRRARAKGSLSICSLGQSRAGRASSRDGSVELRGRDAWGTISVWAPACHEPGVEVRELRGAAGHLNFEKQGESIRKSNK